MTRGDRVLAVMVQDNTHGERRVAPKLAVLTLDLGELDEDHPLTTRSVAPRVHAEVRRLCRAGDGSLALRSEWTDSYPTAAWGCWEPGSSRYTKGWRQVFLDEAAVADAEQAMARYQAHRRRVKELDELVTWLRAQARPFRAGSASLWFVATPRTRG